MIVVGASDSDTASVAGSDGVMQGRSVCQSRGITH